MVVVNKVILIKGKKERQHRYHSRYLQQTPVAPESCIACLHASLYFLKAAFLIGPFLYRSKLGDRQFVSTNGGSIAIGCCEFPALFYECIGHRFVRCRCSGPFCP